jgi:hypothetical protein
VGSLGLVAETFVPAALDTGHDLTPARGIAFQFVIGGLVLGHIEEFA